MSPKKPSATSKSPQKQSKATPASESPANVAKPAGSAKPPAGKKPRTEPAPAKSAPVVNPVVNDDGQPAVSPQPSADSRQLVRKPVTRTRAGAGRAAVAGKVRQPAKPAESSHVERGTSHVEGLRILVVTPEAHPFAKTGGLAEVSAALPAALAHLGHDVTLVVPRYRGVTVEDASARPFELSLGPPRVRGRFLETRTPDGVRATLIDVPELFDRAGLYGENGRDYADNAFRFAAFSLAALEYARTTGERPDVIHTHDWQTGLVPVYQKMWFSQDPVVGGVPAVFTIHNLAFQGVFPANTLAALGLGWEVFNPDALEFWGNISLLKGGVNFSEKITTVSPTYAREIMTPEFGFGFEGVIARRASDLVGIVNGIDVERWNPEADAFVAAKYSVRDLAGKREAKHALLKAAGLSTADADIDRPVIGVISRLTDQKGFDLIGAAAGELMTLDARWVMLGSGERHYEDLWRAMAARHPERVSATIGFDERLAHMIEAGADMFLMPSRFEPCGLNQLYSLRYGTVPIVRATGGLADTVIDAVHPNGNGIKFDHYTRDGLLWAVRRALELYRTDRRRWEELQRNGMSGDRSWDVSAREYVKVYEGLALTVAR